MKRMSRKNTILLAPDSFKGTMTSFEVCKVMADSIKKVYPSANIISIPIADGGEGTMACMREAAGGTLVPCIVQGAYGKEKETYYLKNGDVAVIETAAIAGFSEGSCKQESKPRKEGKEGKEGGENAYKERSLVNDAGEERNPAIATTYGIGQAIKAAINAGCKKILIGLGGSATNDAGAGMISALGARFLDERGNEFIPTGNTLSDIADMDLSSLKENIKGVEFECICDVDNPLYGERGAAYVFAPQKGADCDMVERLDYNLKAFADTTQKHTGVDISKLAGGGAAGGMGAGCYGYLSAALVPGIEAVLSLVHFDELLEDAAIVFTGEGQLDEQSLGGKVVAGVGKKAMQKNVPAVAVVGRTKGSIEGIYKTGIKEVISSVDYLADGQDVLANAKINLMRAMDDKGIACLRRLSDM